MAARPFPFFFVWIEHTAATYSHHPTSCQGVALASTSFKGQDPAIAGKLVDPRAKPEDDGMNEANVS
jgi:hypothetical protein